MRLLCFVSVRNYIYIITYLYTYYSCFLLLTSDDRELYYSCTYTDVVGRRWWLWLFECMFVQFIFMEENLLASMFTMRVCVGMLYVQ